MGRLQGSGAFRPHPPRSAAEPRRQDRGRAATRRARRRDDQPLVAVSDHRHWRQRLRSHDQLRHGPKELRSRSGEYASGSNRCRCLVGNRPLRPPARGRGRGCGRHGRGREHRARRASAGADRRRDELLHARRGDAPARDRACDIGRAGRNAAPCHGPRTRRPRDAVRRRARADRRFESARSHTAARDACRRLAASHRGAHGGSGL